MALIVVVNFFRIYCGQKNAYNTRNKGDGM